MAWQDCTAILDDKTTTSVSQIWEYYERDTFVVNNRSKKQKASLKYTDMNVS